MEKIHNVHSTQMNDTYLYLMVDGQSYRIRWVDCSPRLIKATPAQRSRFEVSSSGYGIHWLEVDEDWAITPLLQCTELLETAPARP